jgi:sulfate/thiosulfate transport system substrate-binding protein
MRISFLGVAAVAASLLAGGLIAAKNVNGYAAHTILNVSYDPTRELYQKINPAFVASHEHKTGETVAIRQSHGGSSYQARQAASGAQPADVATLGLPSDIHGLAKRGLIAQDWRARLPNKAQPYATTVVFVIRKGNPRGIRDWPDLVKGNIEVIRPIRKPPETAS